MKLGGFVIKKIIVKIVLIISIVLLVVSITVFAASFDRSMTGCFVSLFMMPISCILVFVSSLVYKYMVVDSIQAPPSDISTKRLSEVAQERQDGIVFCSSCGVQNNVEWKHCSKCGFKL